MPPEVPIDNAAAAKELVIEDIPVCQVDDVLECPQVPNRFMVEAKIVDFFPSDTLQMIRYAIAYNIGILIS